MNYKEFNEKRVKTYICQMNIGMCKYVITYYSGERFHSDGSIAADLHIERNKIRANAFVRSLMAQGYRGNGIF